MADEIVGLTDMTGPDTTPRNGFDAGVASGDATSNGVVLWTHVTPDGSADVSWEIGRPGGGVEQRGVAQADPEHDHCVHVDVRGLDPATDYAYAFERDGRRVAGRTRTLPETASQLRFVVACCSRWGWPGFDLFDAIIDESPAFVLHLGDSIYEVGETLPNGLATDPPHECWTLDDYRRRHRQSRRDERLERLLASVPLICVWDDHEVADNAPDPGAGERRQAGKRAWGEWMPCRSPQGDRPLDRRFSIEGLVDISLVDSRFGGRSATDVDGPGAAGAAPGDLLSEEQWSELEAFVGRSSAPWLIVANQVQVSPMTLAVRPVIGWPPWRRVVNPDQWDGYPAERDRLARIVRAAPGRSVVLSGDLHSAWSRTWSDGDGPVAHEFTCPSISGVVYAEAVQERLPFPLHAGAIAGWLRVLNRGIDHLDLVRHGYLVCDVTSSAFVATFVTSDGDRHDVALRA